MGNRWGTILVATAFNLLFEYSLRGINNLVMQPLLPLILFVAYFSLFTMVEDLIVRFRFKDYHLIILAFTFGTVYHFLVSGAALLQTSFAGVNWGSLIFVNAVWWGALQLVMTFYLANRAAPRDVNHSLMTKGGWAFFLILNGIVILLFQASGAIPRANVLQILLMILIFLAFAGLLWKILSKTSQRIVPIGFSRLLAMDFLCAATLVVFIVSAIFLTFDPFQSGTSNINRTAGIVVTVWTIISAASMLSYRLYARRSIPV